MGNNRTSNNPFQQSLSAESTGNSANGALPDYPAGSNNDYYTSATEKQRLRERERELERQVQNELPPPSYEEAAGPNARTRERPREKERTRESRESRHHRSRPTDPSRKESSRTHRSSRPSGERSGESREHRSGESREHRSGESRSERERRHKEREKNKSSRSKSKKKVEEPPKNVDTIDKLDVTGLFGGAFHHDGPFDACTPHRNKNSKAAPVLAFPADGPNSSIKGSNHKNYKEHTIKYINGLRDDDDDDLYTASVTRSNVPSLPRNESQDTIAAIKASSNIITFDSNAKADPVHGQTTLGLGSSTFLDGTPASAAATQEESLHRANGLARKKSIKQRLAGSNEIPKPTNKSQENLNEDKIKFSSNEKESSSIPGGNSLLKRVRSLKVGRK